MDVLDITKQAEEKKQQYEECMQLDGTWNKNPNGCETIVCIYKLVYASSEYEYFLGQDNYGEHFIYRNKK